VLFALLLLRFDKMVSEQLEFECSEATDLSSSLFKMEHSFEQRRMLKMSSHCEHTT
jgi:hypothetical protein